MITCLEQHTNNEGAAPRVALFLRSNLAHDHARGALERQRDSLLQYCAERGWMVAAVFEDEGSTASRTRPALRDALAAARRGEFDILLVWDFTRLARGLAELLRIVAELHELGISVHQADARVGTDEPILRILWDAMIGMEEELRRNRIAEARGIAEERRRPPNTGD